jgi:hypothetical protein
MRRLILLLVAVGSLVLADAAHAATGKIIKVLPHFLDTKGRNAKSPSLFDRDVYQTWLRENPAQRGGIRYDVQWRAREVTGKLILRVELRGIAEGKKPREQKLETEVKASSGLARWNELALSGDDYKAFGEVTAWRVTLWEGDQLVAEQASYLW